jgi:hypothetical protein
MQAYMEGAPKTKTVSDDSLSSGVASHSKTKKDENSTNKGGNAPPSFAHVDKVLMLVQGDHVIFYITFIQLKARASSVIRQEEREEQAGNPLERKVALDFGFGFLR